MYRSIRMLAAAALVSTSFMFTGSGPTAVPAAVAAVCPAGQNQAFITLRSTITWTHYRETYSGGGAPSISGRITIASGNAGRITYTFCVGNGTAGWTIRKAPDVVAYSYYGMDSALHVTNGTGFALTPRQVNAKSLVVEPTMCKDTGGVLKFLKFVVGIPIPGLTYIVSVGKWIAGAAIPAGGTSCTAFADLTMPVTFKASNGNTTAGASLYAPYYHKVQIKTGNCVTPPNSCWDVDQYDWRVTP